MTEKLSIDLCRCAHSRGSHFSFSGKCDKCECKEYDYISTTEQEIPIVEDSPLPLGIKESVEDSIDHPSHYGGDTIYEAIKVINAWGLGFELGNALKYICRAGEKDSETRIEDLRKAAWYIQYEINKEEHPVIVMMIKQSEEKEIKS